MSQGGSQTVSRLADIPQDLAQRLQLAMIAGNEPASSYIEIRPLRPAGRQRFILVRELDQAINVISELAAKHDVYIGCAPRVRQSGGNKDVERVWCLRADCDTPESAALARRFRPRPNIVNATGTPDHLQCWWQLTKPATPQDAENANRKLMHALHADKAWDTARVLRAIGTLNHKHAPPRPVTCVRCELDAYTIEQITGSLPDPPESPKPARPATVIRDADDPLREIPATDYVPALTGRQLDRDNKICCPFHDENNPSLHAYDGDGGWYCFGCDIGGSIIDLGAHLYGITPRGAGYHQVRQRVAQELLGAAAA
jgi:hypothetical protein